MDRRPFYDPEVVLADVCAHLKNIQEPMDYLTIVPDGEPTLDSNLGSTCSTTWLRRTGCR